jgi:hypothetical protein
VNAAAEAESVLLNQAEDLPLSIVSRSRFDKELGGVDRGRHQHRNGRGL